jgi:hypothetical protein
VPRCAPRAGDVRRRAAAGTDIKMARWGMPCPPQYCGWPVVNVRNATSSHPELRTLADARDYILKLPDAIAIWQAWLRAGELLLAAAKYPTDDAISAATDQLDRALFMTYRADLAADRRI